MLKPFYGVCMRSLILTLCLFSGTLMAQTSWTGFKGCGLYRVRGIVRIQNNTPVIVVNEKTKSEMVFTLPIPNEPKLSAYIDREMQANLLITEAMNGSKGKGVVKEIEARIPNPIDPKDTGINFITKSECK